MCGLNESLFIETAEAMVKNGLLAAGYNRINLDDCWSLMERSSSGSMVWDPKVLAATWRKTPRNWLKLTL